MLYSSTELKQPHNTIAFDCGKTQLNDWLQQMGLRAQQRRTARTYVWTKFGEDIVVAFYSIAPTQIAADDVSRRDAGGNTVLPGYLLARLALDRGIRERGLGAQLLLDALERIASGAGELGGRIVVVDPIDDEAAAFYTHYGFKKCQTNKTRMYMKIASIQAILER